MYALEKLPLRLKNFAMHNLFPPRIVWRDSLPSERDANPFTRGSDQMACESADQERININSRMARMVISKTTEKLYRLSNIRCCHIS